MNRKHASLTVLNSSTRSTSFRDGTEKLHVLVTTRHDHDMGRDSEDEGRMVKISPVPNFIYHFFFS
jgi:hypothetical protein